MYEDVIVDASRLLLVNEPPSHPLRVQVLQYGVSTQRNDYES